jgi:hypothetical protein
MAEFLDESLQTSWDDESIIPSSGGRGSIKRFRLSMPGAADRTTKTGGTERIAILVEGPVKVMMHYCDTTKGAVSKGYFRCAEGKYGACPMCEEAAKGSKERPAKCGEAKLRLACNVWVYDTDKDGKLVLGPNGEVSGEVMLWQFSDKVFSQLREVKRAWGDLRKHDFIVTPDGDLQFQQVNLTIQPTSAFLTAPNRAELVEQYKDELYDVQAIVGKDYTPDELYDKLFGEGNRAGYRSPQTPAEAARAALNVPTDDLLKELGENLESSPAAAPARAATPAGNAAPQSAAAAEGWMDLDDLMGQLGTPV